MPPPLPIFAKLSGGGTKFGNPKKCIEEKKRFCCHLIKLKCRKNLRPTQSLIFAHRRFMIILSAKCFANICKMSSFPWISMDIQPRLFSGHELLCLVTWCSSLAMNCSAKLPGALLCMPWTALPSYLVLFSGHELLCWVTLCSSLAMNCSA